MDREGSGERKSDRKTRNNWPQTYTKRMAEVPSVFVITPYRVSNIASESSKGPTYITLNMIFARIVDA